MIRFPISYDENQPYPQPASMNHQGATLFPLHVDEYICKEISFGAMIGPFKVPLFIERIGIPPLSTRPKKGSDQRRIILDLSFPCGESVNDGIDKTMYCGNPIKLSYPTIDTLTDRIIELGQCCLIWKCDLSRYFRQVPLCPRDYSLIGIRWKGMFYFDTVMPMGLRSAAYVCQRLTNAVTFLHRELGYWSINYLDDFGSAESSDKAWDSYLALNQLLTQLGIQESTGKAIPPCTRMEFLGTLVETVDMTLGITPERKTELMNELRTWTNQKYASKRQLQSLIGKLSFVTNCVKFGRVFLNRLIHALSMLPEQKKGRLPSDICNDIEWWKGLISQYSGVSMLWLKDYTPWAAVGH